MLIRHSPLELRKVNMDRIPKVLVCVGEIVGKIGKVGGRELVLVVSVRCGKERDMTRGLQLFWDTNMSDPEPSSS